MTCVWEGDMVYLIDLYNTITEPEPPQTWPQKDSEKFGNYFIFTANATITGTGSCVSSLCIRIVLYLGQTNPHYNMSFIASSFLGA